MDVEARITLGLDRGEDFTTFTRMRYDAWDIRVATHGDTVVGFVELGHGLYHVGSITVRGTYAGLAGVRAGSRGSSTFPRLLRSGEEAAAAAETKFGFALLNEKNLRYYQFLQRRFRGTRQGAPIHGVCVLLGPAYAVRKRYEFRRASAADLPAVTELLAKMRDRHTIRPAIREKGLPELPGLEPADILLACHRGRIVACLGMWDQEALRKILVLRYALPEQTLVTFLNATRGILNLPALPHAGEALRIVHGVFPAAETGYEDAWGDLVRQACRQLRFSGRNLFVVGLPATSPLLPSFGRLPRFTNVNLPLILPFTDEVADALGDSDPIDFALEYALC